MELQVTRSRVSMAATAVSTVEKATPTPAAPEKLALEPKIQGRTVVITGGSQGVGKALAKKFAAAGFNVVVAARQADRWNPKLFPPDLYLALHSKLLCTVWPPPSVRHAYWYRNPE